MKNRIGEAGRVPPRSSRFFYLKNHWYTETREGVTLGPFDHADEGQKALDSFIDFMEKADEQTRTSYLRFVRSDASEQRRTLAK